MALRDQPIETQLQAARMVSFVLLLLTVMCAWGVAVTISPIGHPLRWLLPCGMAVLPAFIDLMTAVNNDAGAIAMFSLFLWGSMRLLKQRTWANALWVALSAIAAASMKSTALFSLPLAALVFVLTFTPGKLRWIIVASVPVLMGVIALVAMGSGDPAYWYRNASQDTPMRCEGKVCAGQLAAGHHAFALAPASEMIQLIPPQDVERLQGQTVTLGAWMWQAGDAANTQMPALQFHLYSQPDNPIVATHVVSISTQPTWLAYTMTVPGGVQYGSVTLKPAQTQGAVFMDELALVAGDHLFDTPAMIAALPNAIRNGSAEESWPWLRTWAQARITDLFSDPLQYNFLMSPLDPAGAGHYYELSARLLFETFWARFSWAQVAVPPAVFTLLAVNTASSVILTLVTWPRWRRWLRFDHVFVMAMAVIALWALTLLRGTPLLNVLTFLNVARYTYPAIIPALVLLLLGWSEAAVMLESSPKGLQILKWAGVIFALSLAMISLATIALFFANH